MSSEAILGVIADRTRRRLLKQLAVEPSSVTTLGKHLGISDSAVSQHLKILRGVGLVTFGADGRRRVNSLAPGALELVQREVEGILHRPPCQESGPGTDPLEALAHKRAKAWPQLDALNILISFRVERLVHAMHRDMRRIAAKAGLSLGEMLALGAIAAIGPPYETSPTELKDALWISLPGVGKRLDLLESRGMIERLPNPADRRGRVVRLTARGQAALVATRVGTRNPSYVALAQMPQDQKIELERLLRLWQRSTERGGSP